MDAPTGRPPFTVITGRPFFGSTFVVIFVLLLVAYDLWSTRKVHRATIWAGLSVVIAEQLQVRSATLPPGTPSPPGRKLSPAVHIDAQALWLHRR